MTAALGALVVLGIAAARAARLRFAKDGRAAGSFIVPGVAALIAGIWLAATGAGVVAIPALAGASAFIAAGSIFMPTRGSRFREFERRFWEHVLHYEQHAHR